MAKINDEYTLITLQTLKETIANYNDVLNDNSLSDSELEEKYNEIAEGLGFDTN